MVSPVGSRSYSTANPDALGRREDCFFLICTRNFRETAYKNGVLDLSKREHKQEDSWIIF